MREGRLDIIRGQPTHRPACKSEYAYQTVFSSTEAEQDERMYEDFDEYLAAKPDEAYDFVWGSHSTIYLFCTLNLRTPYGNGFLNITLPQMGYGYKSPSEVPAQYLSPLMSF